MSYPPPPADGAPDPYQPPQPPPADPTLQYPPPYSPPTSPAPTSGGPGYGQPTSGAPGYGQPTSGAPGYSPPPTSGPGYGAPTSGYGQPGYPPPPGYPPTGDKNPFGGPAQFGQPAYGSPYGPPQVMPTNTMAILSLVFAFIFAPVAIVLGHLAKKQISRSGEQGGGLATAGLVLGYIFTGIMVIYCAVVIAAIVFSAGTSGTSTY
ncbi:DUF4190 domain-containing protein [Actinoplanes sp. G11-F43]|uniref:DUF4190 domain-containing protein n=1 Tax=Actinoplanes sp. G11-F43 TaxID=3424130 RepID=UPI003D32B5DA